MSKALDFTRLIGKYSKPFTITFPGEGSYVGGQWIETEGETVSALGAILPVAGTAKSHAASDGIIQALGGSYELSDRVLYTTQPIDRSLKGAVLRYKDESYHIVGESDYGDYADAYIYALKRVNILDTDQGS